MSGEMMLKRFGQGADSRPEPEISAEFTAPTEFMASSESAASDEFIAPDELTASAEFMAPDELTASAEFMAPDEFTASDELTAPDEFTLSAEFTAPAEPTAPADGDILELEISAEDLIGLWSASTARHQDTTPSARTAAKSLTSSPDFGKKARAAIGKLTSRGPAMRIAASFLITSALVVSGAAAYRATKANAPQPHPSDNTLVQAQIPQPEPAHDQKPPVRLKNPFDPSEVFEFPPGTSKRKARAMVAELLMERARGRQTRHGRKSDRVRYGAAGPLPTRR